VQDALHRLRGLPLGPHPDTANAVSGGATRIPITRSGFASRGIPGGSMPQGARRPPACPGSRERRASPGTLSLSSCRVVARLCASTSRIDDPRAITQEAPGKDFSFCSEIDVHLASSAGSRVTCCPRRSSWRTSRCVTRSGWRSSARPRARRTPDRQLLRSGMSRAEARQRRGCPGSRSWRTCFPTPSGPHWPRTSGCLLLCRR